MKTDRELLEQALEKLEICWKTNDVIDAIKERLAQQEQEPVMSIRTINGALYSWMTEYQEGFERLRDDKTHNLYATPPARPWQSLTDEDILHRYQKYGTGRIDGFTAAIREIEQISKERNHD